MVMVIEMVVATSVEVAAVKRAKVATVAPGVKGGGEGGAGGGGKGGRDGEVGEGNGGKGRVGEGTGEDDVAKWRRWRSGVATTRGSAKTNRRDAPPRDCCVAAR